MLQSVSFTRWDVFSQCPYRAWLAYGERIPEPKNESKKELPHERGNRIHDGLEKFVLSQGSCPQEAHYFYTPVQRLTALKAQRPTEVVVEKMWCFDKHWNYLGEDPPYNRIWLRVKEDVFAFLSPTEGVSVDYKSGKRYGNETKHTLQGQIYAIAAFKRYPSLRTVWSEFWYLDKDYLHRLCYKWPAALRLYQNWTERLQQVTNARTFPPRPNKSSCKYCPFKTGLIGRLGPEGTGHCNKNLSVESD